MTNRTFLVATGLTLIAAVGVAVGVASSGQGSESPTKEELLQNEAERRLAALQSATPGILGPTSSMVLANEKIASSQGAIPDSISHPAGDGMLIEEGLAPFPAQFYSFNNSWVLETGANKIHVWAGNLRRDGTGVLKISRSTSGGEAEWFNYLTPFGGSVHIVDADGRVLTIESAQGDAFYLDTEQMELTDEAGEPISPLTPTPTPSPYPTLSGTLPFEIPTLTPTVTPTTVPTAVP